ncbi:hypothetical protein Plec18167_001244 [Paecilomyces lecythidis]|uniref:Dynamin N-terminal domain-containing protein n=1 Tax=Paecilomyces lecythidis TaxID=3004212 RepID=A0ABR3YCC5_9EURO
MESQVAELLSTLGRHTYGYLTQDFLGRFPRSSLLMEAGVPYVVALGKKGGGKSSLLRALSGIPFPTGSDGTIIATEVILRREERTCREVSMIFLTSEVGSETPSAIGLTLEKKFDIPRLIQDAERQARDLKAWVPGEHILRIEVSGINLPHVAFVDLPGSTGDVIKDAIVDKLIQRYVSDERTVVLNAISGSDMSISANVSGLPPNRTINVIVEPETVDPQISLYHLRSLFAERIECDEKKPWQHLTDLPRRFEMLVNASINGEYGDVFFEIGDFNLRRMKIVIDETKHYLRSRLQRRAQEIRLLEANAHPSSISDFLAASQEGSELIQQFDPVLQQDSNQHSSGLEGKILVEKFVFLLTKDWLVIIEECMYRITQGCLSLTHQVLRHTTAPLLSDILYKRVVVPASRSRETAALAKIRELAASRCLPEIVTVTPELQHELEKLQKCLERTPGPDDRDAIYSNLLCCSRIYFELCLETIIGKIEKEVIEKCLLDGLPELLLHAANDINIPESSLRKMLRDGCAKYLRLSTQAECMVAYLTSKSDGARNWPSAASREAARRRIVLGSRLKKPPTYMSDWCLQRESSLRDF